MRTLPPIYRVPTQVPVWWEASIGKWVVSLPPNYPKASLRMLRDYMLREQQQRRLGLIPGDLRDDLDKSVEALKNMAFVFKAQHDSSNRAILVETDRRDNPSRTFNFPKGA